MFPQPQRGVVLATAVLEGGAIVRCLLRGMGSEKSALKTPGSLPWAPGMGTNLVEARVCRRGEAGRGWCGSVDRLELRQQAGVRGGAMQRAVSRLGGWFLRRAALHFDVRERVKRPDE